MSCILAFICIETMGQGELPDVLKDNLEYPAAGCEEEETSLRSKLKGALFQYSVSAPYSVDNTSDGVNYRGRVESETELHYKYKIPVINTCNYKLLLGHHHYTRQIEFSPSLQASEQLVQLESKTLKSNRISVYNLITLDSNSALGVTFSAAFNGDYDGFIRSDKRYAIYRGVLLYTKKQNKNDEWGVGLYYKNGFRSTYLLPFGIYNKSFNKKWGLEAIILSRVLARYNHRDNSIFLFGAEYRSRDFSVDINVDETDFMYNMKWPKIHLKGIWQRKFIGPFWLEIQAGLQYNLDPTLDASPFFIPGQNVSVNSHSFMCSLGLFFTPPDSWLD